MCEPYHSISQWSSDEPVHTAIDKALELVAVEGLDDIGVIDRERVGRRQLLPSAGEPIGGPGDNVAQWQGADDPVAWNDDETSKFRLQLTLGPVAQYLSEIAGFFHLSRFGTGHSESKYGKGDKWFMLPTPTCYEIHWWNREVQFDGGLATPRKLTLYERNPKLLALIRDTMKKEAIKACTEYANRTSIGNPGSLRRFLEETIQTSDRMIIYEDVFRRLFSPVGLHEYEGRLKLAGIVGFREFDNDRKVRLAKVICGMTRVRKFMNPEWADVPEFWK